MQEPKMGTKGIAGTVLWVDGDVVGIRWSQPETGNEYDIEMPITRWNRIELGDETYGR